MRSPGSSCGRDINLQITLKRSLNFCETSLFSFVSKGVGPDPGAAPCEAVVLPLLTRPLADEEKWQQDRSTEHLLSGEGYLQSKNIYCTKART